MPEIYPIFSVLNAQLPPEDIAIINDILFPPTGDTQVLIPAGAITHQRSVESMY